MTDTLIDLIDLADDTGFGTIMVSSYYVPRTMPKVRVDAVRKMLESGLYGQSLLTLKLSQLKRWVKDIEAKATVDDAGNWHIRLNLARLFMLPCENPAAELVEMRAFLEAMKPFFESNAHRRADVQFCNHRTRNGAVYGTVACRFENGDMMAHDVEHTERLRAMVESSPALQAFMRTVALALQRLGPWSWVCVDEDQLYGKHQGPNSTAWIQGHINKQAGSQ